MHVSPPITSCMFLARRVKEIEASKAPQVLTIGHDEDEGDEDEDATSSSSEEEEDSECSSNGASDGYETFSRPTSLATAAELESCEGVWSDKVSQCIRFKNVIAYQ